MIKKPNLFNYATCELSQDAFICWLLTWAKPEFESLDLELHECGLNLIDSFFVKHSKKTPISIDKIEIKKQDKQIDVLCILNNKFALIIEDKTNTTNHSDQLNKYYNDVSQRGMYLKEDIIPIYFKTGDQCSYENIEDKGYKVFHRIDFLKVLNEYNGSNQILLDYREHLQSIQDRIVSYKTLPIKKWEWESWIGFYIELQKHLKKCGWDYVANPSGGFLGFWWYFKEQIDCQLYLQLEENKLCFKIEVEDKSKRTTLRDLWHKNIMAKGKMFEIDLIKPKRFGLGTWMTVCVYEGEYRKCNNGIINIEKTVEELKKAEKLVESFT